MIRFTNEEIDFLKRCVSNDLSSASKTQGRGTVFKIDLHRKPHELYHNEVFAKLVKMKEQNED
tara:strand:+ start:156 stop:344 length:189 start_codon:yes stop_codon:yes gene_type:complete